MDEIYWGTSAGSGQPFFNLSFTTGKPIAEGDSIGRSSTGAWTGQASDFAVAGGKNAMGVTPGERNMVDPPPQEDLLLYQDHILNSLFEALSNSFDQRGWLQVTGSAPSVGSYTTDGSTTKLIAQHVITVLIEGESEAVALTGSVSTTVTSSSSGYDTWEHYASSGEIGSTSGQYGLSFNMARANAGAHTLQQGVAYTTNFEWTHQGIPYSASMQGTRTTTRTGQNTVVVSDSRQGADWGGLQKSGSLQATFLKLGDGIHQVSSIVQRTFPSQLPYPGSIHFDSHMESLREDLTTVTNGLGEIASGWITFYEQGVDGSVLLALRSGEIGTVSTTHSVQGPLQTVVTTYGYPLEQFGSPLNMVVSVAMVTDESDPAKSVHYGELRATQNGNQVYAFDFFIDPPLGEKNGLGKRLASAAATTVLCTGAGIGGQATVESKSGKRAMIRMFSKAAAKKAIPVVGWAITGACVGKAIINF